MVLHLSASDIIKSKDNFFHNQVSYATCIGMIRQEELTLTVSSV